jgi:hypothetical protein
MFLLLSNLMPLPLSMKKVELVQTLDECKMCDYIPESTSDGLREILLGCLSISPCKLESWHYVIFIP